MKTVKKLIRRWLDRMDYEQSVWSTHSVGFLDERYF